MVDATCEAMARGGLYDQLGGGFARYSVDREWVVPHFEKMLYDNALLLGVYARWGTPLGDRVAAETADFMVRELGTAEGGFAAALDADSEGEEGRFYVWTPDQLVEVLGEDDGRWAAALLSVTDARHVRARQLDAPAARRPRRRRAVGRRTPAADGRPRARVRPARDDKVVAAWNGLAIASLVDAGRAAGPRGPRRRRPSGRARCSPTCTCATTARCCASRATAAAGRHRGVLEDHGCVAARLPRPRRRHG